MPLNVITSRTNSRVKQLRAAFAGNARLAQELVAIEGENLVREAMRSGIALQAVFLRDGAAAPEWLDGRVEQLWLAGDVFSSAVDTQSPQGIAALIEPPQWELESVLSGSRATTPLFLVAAGLQDPGNLGTLVRSAEAFGATAVMTTQGTVSVWNQKSIRASAGSVFRLPVIGVLPDELRGLKVRGVRLLAAAAEDALKGAASSLDLKQPIALMIGNEGAGVAPDLLALADARISIPMPGPVESLNAAVAGSLLLYEAARQRGVSHIGTEATV